jgi:ribonuclease HII
MITDRLHKNFLTAGVDEVGRGPLAGPVFAAAVILNPCKIIHGLTDSKQLTPKKRQELAQEIYEHAHAWGIGSAEVDEIDRINIFQASLLAMQRAVFNLAIKPKLVLIDGLYCPILPYPTQAIVKGDLLIQAISAASILAKVTRDALMNDLDIQYPGYDFKKNKGYPTTQHRAALKTLGITPIHRRSFMPVKQYLNTKT